MKTFYAFLIFSAFLLVNVMTTEAQLNKALQDKLAEKAKELAKEKVASEVEKKQTGYDTSSFNYAIAFLDKSESFEDKQKGEGMIKTANFYIKEQSGKTDLERARDIYELGRINYNRRLYSTAEYNLKAAAALYESLGAKSDPVYFKTQGLLGLLFSDMGRYEKAEKYTLAALDGWKNHFGELSTGYVAEYNNLGVLKMKKGQFIDAESQMLYASEKIKTLQGEKSTTYAISLNNLSILYQYMGREKDALELITKSTQIAATELREKSGTYIQLLTNKAIIQQENKLLKEAEATYLEAKQLQENRLKVNAKSDPDYAHLLNNLASLYVLKGQLSDAENYLKRSIDIYMAKFTNNHPVTACAQADLANLYRFQGKYDEAEQLLIIVRQVREQKLGPEHPETIQTLEDLAVVKWKKGEIAAA